MIESRDLYVIFETIAGSHLYGTNVETSDLDIRGVGIATLRHALGVERFDQLDSKSPDRTIFSLQKFFKLAADANPNIIELLFAPKKHWRVDTPWWQRVVDERHLFLSVEAKKTFSGYAYSQLKRIKNHKKWMDNPPEKPDRAAMGLSVESAMQPDAVKALATIPQKIIGDLNKTAQLEKAYAKLKKEWDAYRMWKKGRNPDRFKLEAEYGYDTKHAMHLVRLLRMGVEILTTGELHVDRTDVDADELRRIREGSWSYERLVGYAEEMDTRLTKLYNGKGGLSQNLPKKPNRKRINNLLMEILCAFFHIDAKAAAIPFAGEPQRKD